MIAALLLATVLSQGSSTMAGSSPAAVGSTEVLGADFFTYGLSAPASGAQCAGAVLTSDQSDAITCTRAGTAYCQKADGTLVSTASNRCRLEATGILVEGARTNLVLRSQTLDNAAWTKTNASVTADSTVAPDGTTTADTITASAGSSADHYVASTTFAEADQGLYTRSVYIKAGTVNYVAISALGDATIYGAFDLAGASVTGTSLTVNASITSIGSGWYRCVIEYQAASAASRLLAIHPGDTAAHSVPGTTWNPAGTETVIAWAAQAEAAGYVSSYVPTVATAAARPDETVSFVPTQSITSKGCTAITATFPPGKGTSEVLISGAALWNTPVYWAGSNSVAMADDTNFPASVTTGASAFSRTIVIRSHWGNTAMGLDVGATVGPNTLFDSTMNMSTVYLGSGSTPSNHFFGHIRGVKLNTSARGCQ